MIEAKRFQEYPPVNSPLVPDIPRRTTKVASKLTSPLGSNPFAGGPGVDLRLAVDPALIHRRVYFGFAFLQTSASELFGALEFSFQGDLLDSIPLHFSVLGQDFPTSIASNILFPFVLRKKRWSFGAYPFFDDVVFPPEVLIFQVRNPRTGTLTDGDALSYQMVCSPVSMTMRLDSISFRLVNTVTTANGTFEDAGAESMGWRNLACVSQSWPF